MTTSRMSSHPFEIGDLVVCHDSKGPPAPGLVIDCRTTPHAYRDSECTVPAYEVDVLFSTLNPFLRAIQQVTKSETNLLTVSDAVIRHL